MLLLLFSGTAAPSAGSVKILPSVACVALNTAVGIEPTGGAVKL